MAKKFDAQSQPERDPISGCEEVIRGIYGERRCGDFVASRDSGRAFCAAHQRNWELAQAGIAQARERAQAYLAERGVVRDGMTPGQRVAAMYRFRQRLKTEGPDEDRLSWARLILSRIADGEKLPLAVQRLAEEAMRADSSIVAPEADR